LRRLYAHAMPSPQPSPSPGARRRLVAVGTVAAAALATGTIVGGGHGNSSAGPRPSELRKGASAHAGLQPHPGPVPILMYHRIERPRPGVRNPLLYVSGRSFAAQMRWLDRHGFDGVTLDQVEDGWTKGAPLPRRPIVVSFDDGYLSHYRTVMPILRRHHWPGVLSLAVKNMTVRAGLTPTEVQRLLHAGWELASHTISHVDLRLVGRRRLRHEVRDSRRLLRYVFHVPADNFTYPAGLYDRRAVAAVRAAGYRGALTVAPGLASRRHPFALKRIRVTQEMSVRGLARKLRVPGV
jgi:peptidoglycan/xylan/chitin deacetylase (PgdA/CDA1 family)